MRHDVDVELFYDGVWNSAPAYTRDPIKLVHGRGDEQATAAPSSCQLTLDNRAGLYNPRHPAGPLFGKIGRNTPIRVTVDGAVRFAGEVASWQPRRPVDAGDAWVELECNGVTRRLGQGASPAPSAPRTFLLGTDPVAYWPVEDGPQSLTAQLAAGAGGGIRLPRGVAAPQVWGQGKLADWLAPSAKIADENLGSVLRAGVTMTGFVDTWTLEMIRTGGDSEDIGGTLMTAVWSPPAAAPVFTILRFDAPNSQIHVDIGFSTLASAAVDRSLWDDNPHHVRLTATQDGADIDYQVFIDGALELSATDTAETLGPVGEMAVTIAGAVSPAFVFGHWAVWTTPPALADSVAAAFGHNGEAAGRRIERLCTEQGVGFTSTGDLDDTAAVGPQYPDPPLAIMAEAAEADLGFLVDAVDTVGLHYRTRVSLHNQAPALALSFTDGGVAPTLDPAVDDQLVRNDVTVTRRSGGEHQAVDQAGPLGVDTIGRYDTSVALNVVGDGFLANQASWRLHLGTVDEDRWPRVAVDLDAAPELADAVDAVRVGDLIALDDLPATIAGAELALLMVHGWAEVIGSHRRVVTFTTSPASPFDVAVYGAAAGGLDRYDTAGSELAEHLDTTETGVDVAVTVKPLWTTDAAETPFDVIVGGEVMRVQAVAGASSPQTFTVARSVNGVAKAHPAGTPVRLHRPPRYALG